MRYLSLAMILTFLTASASILCAQWNAGLFYQHDNRGYRWDNTSSGPQTGFGLEFGHKIYKILPHLSISGEAELQTLANSYAEWFVFDEPLLLMETTQRVNRVGVVSYVQLNIRNFYTYIGIGGGIEHFNQDVELGSGAAIIDIDWLEGPLDRVGTSPYFTGLLGFQINIFSFFTPFIEGRYYFSSHSNQDFKTQRNLIRNSFNGIQLGFRFEL